MVVRLRILNIKLKFFPDELYIIELKARRKYNFLKNICIRKAYLMY